MNKINGRTPEEIKRGLEYCIRGGNCGACSYDIGCAACIVYLEADALVYIQQLEAELAEARKDIDMLGEQAIALDSAYDAMKRERDAAVKDLETMGEDRAYCDTCLHNNTNSKEEPCSSCMSGYLINNWQWRGVQEVE